MSDLQRVLDRFPTARPKGATPAAPLGYYAAPCPGAQHHRGDRRSSLSIRPMVDGGISLHCFTGCSHDEIVTAAEIDPAWLRADGRPLILPSLRPRPPAAPAPTPDKPKRVKRLAVTWYEIRDVAGVVQAYHKREDWQLADGTTEKAVTWYRPDPDRPGQRLPTLGGRALDTLPLYGGERLDSLPQGAAVVVTEGEKAAEALWQAGIPAVGTVTGAGGTPGRAALQVLTGYDPVLWPDNDDQGRDHMQRVAGVLAELHIAPRCFAWRHAAAKDDAADWLDRPGADPADLVKLLDNAPVWTPPAPAEATSPDRPRGTCPTCVRDRRNVIELAQFKGAVVRAIRAKNLKKAERLILIEDALALEEYQRATGTDGPFYNPHARVAKLLGMNRDTVADARERFRAAGAIVLTEGKPPADLVERGAAKEYDGACVGTVPPADEREAALCPSARHIICAINRVGPRTATSTVSTPRKVKVASVLPETFQECEHHPGGRVLVTIACDVDGCDPTPLWQNHVVTTPTVQTTRKNSAGLPLREEPPSQGIDAPDSPARFVAATPVAEVVRRRRAMRIVKPATPEHRDRPRCQAPNCRAFALEGSDYCAPCQRAGWPPAEASTPAPEPAPVAEPPPVAPPTNGHGCATCGRPRLGDSPYCWQHVPAQTTHPPSPAPLDGGP